MKIHRSIYFDPDVSSIDEEIKDLIQDPSNKTKVQNLLRERTRTGHVLHSLLGEVAAISVHDLIMIDEEDRLDMLVDIIQHQKKMIQMIKNKTRRKPPVSTAVPDKTVSTEEIHDEEPVKKKHGFGRIPEA